MYTTISAYDEHHYGDVWQILSLKNHTLQCWRVPVESPAAAAVAIFENLQHFHVLPFTSSSCCNVVLGNSFVLYQKRGNYRHQLCSKKFRTISPLKTNLKCTRLTPLSHTQHTEGSNSSGMGLKWSITLTTSEVIYGVILWVYVMSIRVVY